MPFQKGNKSRTGMGPTKGSFKKGNHPKTEFKKGSLVGHKFKKGNHPKTEFKQGHNLNFRHDNLIGNKAMHARIVKNHGKAKNYKCVDCGKQAEEWSNIKDHIYTDKIEDYLPRCKKCHRKYDNPQ